ARTASRTVGTIREVKKRTRKQSTNNTAMAEVAVVVAMPSPPAPHPIRVEEPAPVPTNYQKALRILAKLVTFGGLGLLVGGMFGACVAAFLVTWNPRCLHYIVQGMLPAVLNGVTPSQTTVRLVDAKAVGDGGDCCCVDYWCTTCCGCCND